MILKPEHAQLRTVEQATLIINVVTGGYQATHWLQFNAPNPVMDMAWVNPEIVQPPPAFCLNFSRLKDDEIGVKMRPAT